MVHGSASSTGRECDADLWLISFHQKGGSKGWKLGKVNLNVAEDLHPAVLVQSGCVRPCDCDFLAQQNSDSVDPRDPSV